MKFVRLLVLLTVSACATRSSSHAGVDPLPRSPVVLASPPPHSEGTICDDANDDYECAPDKAAVMRCSGRRWHLAGRCLGAAGCISNEHSVRCDDTIADIGTPCANEAAAACATDKTKLLTCRDGVMVENSSCRGARHCDSTSGRARCDTTIAEPADPCGVDGEAACTPDGSAIVQCRNHVMVETTTCKTPCLVNDTEISCR